MSSMMKTSLVLSVVVLALGMVTCDFNPTAPFAGFDGQASQGTVGTEGATLNGRFVGSGSALTMGGFALTAQDDLFAVILDSGDNEIGRVEVVNGTFTLRGLPEEFWLVFEDASGNRVGDGDPIPFESVKPNQEIDIVLDIVDGNVVILEQKRTGIDHEGAAGIELEGAAWNIQWKVPPKPDDPMTGSFDVNGEHVLTRAGETSIRKGNRSLTLDDLEDGDQVHVRGVFEGTDVFAYEVKLQEEEEDEDDTDPLPECPLDPAKPGHILICHNHKVLSVSKDAWPGHKGHGDKCAKEGAKPKDPC